jgi:hypothetical protein
MGSSHALVLVAVLSVVLLVGGGGARAAKNPLAKKQHCTHGVSPIRPVTVENGKVVDGSIVPYT